jgi:hypothetical protein
MKQKPSFPHDQDAHLDTAIQELIKAHGMAAYGQWWILVELLRARQDHRLPINNDTAIELTGKLQCTAPELKALIACMVQHGLLQRDSSHIWSEELIRRMKLKGNRSISTRNLSFKIMAEEEFKEIVFGFADKYPKTLLQEFFDYWREPSASGRMRLSLEDTWDTNLRLQRWARNNFNKQQVTGQQAPVVTLKNRDDDRERWQRKLSEG